MPITANDLRWFKSERMTDEDDGGGRLTSQEIVWGPENQVFDDISDVDRAAGDVSIRKIYASVASLDDAKYLDAGVVVLRPPADPNVSVVAFSTGDYYDERADLANRLESQIVRGAVYTGWLWGDHVIGQRAVTLWQRSSADLPTVGQRLELLKRESSVTTAAQMLWVTRITTELVERTDEEGTYQVRMVVCEIAEALRYDFIGLEPSRIDPSSQGTNGTLIYETRYNPGAVNVVGAAPLAEAADLGAYTVTVDSLYQPLIPTAFAESALADVNPGGETASLVPTASGTVSRSTTLDVIKPGAAMYLGGPCKPGTLSIAVSGATITDLNGAALLAGGQIGSVDYGAGVVTWNNSCPAYGTASKVVTYVPAAIPMRVADTASQAVTVENRGFVWVMTLTPIPMPGTLRARYRANDEWYLLSDQGNGQLAGVDGSYGSGQINFDSGTVTLTTGALPDPDSEIIYAWGTAADYTQRGGSAVDPVKLRGQTAYPAVAPGTVTITGDGLSLTDDSAGLLTGTGGSGKINYTTGVWEITPTTLPTKGAQFTVDYQYGDPVEEVFNGPARTGDDIIIELAATPIAATVEVEWTLELLDADAEDAWGLTEEFIPFPRYDQPIPGPGLSAG